MGGRLKIMKNPFLLLIVALFLSSCGTAAKRSEFWQHDTMYQNWDHLKFSLFGYTNPTEETLKKSQEQGWWGVPVYSSSER
jgi:hypothetical protein